MRVLFLFLDGIGLGEEDPTRNPFARAHLPHLTSLLEGRLLTRGAAPFSNQRATLLALDACLGVSGLPQSATGQAALLTGRNVPAEVGYHYGPKPDPVTAAALQDGGLFGALVRAGKHAALLNAYPPGYFQGIRSGRRLHSAIPLAVTRAGLPLHTVDDLLAGRALSADLTGAGWRERLGYPAVPLLSPLQAGLRLAELARLWDFAFFEYWLTDYAGHAQDMEAAVRLLTGFDAVLGGLLSAWNGDAGLIVLTSDHGNLEDLTTRRHTCNPVPLLLIGDARMRQAFLNATDLTSLAPNILTLLA